MKERRAASSSAAALAFALLAATPSCGFTSLFAVPASRRSESFPADVLPKNDQVHVLWASPVEVSDGASASSSAAAVVAEPPQFLRNAKEQASVATDNSSVTVSTDELLSSIVQTALRASRTLGKILGEDAEGASRRVIESTLLGKYPTLKILFKGGGGTVDCNGEENKTDISGVAKEINGEEGPELKFHLPEGDLRTCPDELDLSDVVLYVDPLHGSPEAASCLIGACFRGGSKPLMGAIGGMRAAEEDGAPGRVEVVYGLVGRGVGRASGADEGDKIGCSPLQQRAPGDEDLVTVSSPPSGNDSVLLRAVELAGESPEEVLIRICAVYGNKRRDPEVIGSSWHGSGPPNVRRGSG